MKSVGHLPPPTFSQTAPIPLTPNTNLITATGNPNQGSDVRNGDFLGQVSGGGKSPAVTGHEQVLAGADDGRQAAGRVAFVARCG